MDPKAQLAADEADRRTLPLLSATGLSQSLKETFSTSNPVVLDPASDEGGETKMPVPSFSKLESRKAAAPTAAPLESAVRLKPTSEFRTVTDFQVYSGVS